MGTKQFDSATDLITFTRASGGTALRKISYGNELITNGDFATDSDWTKGTGWTIANGKATFDPTGQTANSDLVGSTVNLVSSTVSNISIDGSYRYEVTGVDGLAYVLSFDVAGITATGLDQLRIIVGSSVVRFRALNPRVFSGYIDNISVKEVLYDQPSGTLQLFNHPNNTPRIEYNADGTVKGLLIEKARTNTFRYSEKLSNVDQQLSLTENSTTAPDGQLTADLCVPSNITTEHFLADQQVTVGTSYAVSFFGKYHSGNYIIGFRGGGIGSNYPRFNLETGTIVNEGSNANWTDTKIEDVGNGWYRCSSVGTPTSPTAWRIQFCDGGSATFSGDGTGHYIWGVQAEAGLFPTSYIPTTGGTATRAADNASIPTSAFGYNDNAGTVVVTASVERSVTQGGTGIFTLNTILNSNTSNGGMGSFYRANNTLGINVWDSSGTSVLDKTPTGDVDNRTITLAFAIKKGDFAIVTDYYQTVITQASGQLPAPITVLQLGKWVNDSDILCGHIKSIKYYPRRLTNTQLQELTT